MGSKKNGIRTESAAFDEKLGKTRYKTLPNLHYHRFLFEIDRLISIVRLMERKKKLFFLMFIGAWAIFFDDIIRVTSSPCSIVSLFFFLDPLRFPRGFD